MIMFFYSIWLLLAYFRCAFYANWRGMHHSWGTQINRLMYGTFLGIEFEVIAHIWRMPDWTGLACALLAFITAIEGNSDESQDNALSHAEMSILMTVILGIILAPFIYYCRWTAFFSVFGLLGGVGYWLGYQMKSSLTIFGIKFCVPGDVSWGEAYNGLFVFGNCVAMMGFYGLYKFGLSL